MDSNANIMEAFEQANHRHKNGKIPLVIAFNKTSNRTKLHGSKAGC